MRPLRRRPRSLPALVLGVALLASACGSDDTTDDTTDDGGAPAGFPGTLADDSVSGMLALLPPMDDDELGVVAVSRWHAAAEAHGVTVPSAGADTDEIVEYLTALSVGDGGLAPASDMVGLSTAAIASTEEDFGFALQEVGADVSAGLPPRMLQAARGDFDRDAVVEGTRSGPVADDVEEVDVDGVPVLRWREDFETDLERRTALSRIGSAGRLGLPDDGTLLYATHDDGIEALVAAQQGGESLADDADLAAVARALDAEDVLSAQLTTRLDGSRLTYAAVGIGFAWDDGSRVVLAYATGGESDAESLAASLEELVTSGRSVVGGRPWSDLLGAPEIRVEGSLVTAAFTPEGPSARWAQFLPARENLF